MNKVIIPIVALVGFSSLLLLYLAGTGYKSGSFELGQAFTLLRYCAYGGITAVGLVIFLMVWLRPTGLPVLILFVSALAGLAAFYLPYRQQQIAVRVPPIHDITTNIGNPPRFVAVVPLRASAPNPPDYLGGETAELQRQFYPDIMTQVYVQAPGDVYAAATDVISDMGWEMVDANLNEGRIEATDTTRWFGFKDDVVIRLQAGPAQSTVMDMRSKSRVGRSDIGVNANRIRTFTAALNEKLMVEN
jgi:uncharacterized protein (DUF1499 family)